MTNKPQIVLSWDGEHLETVRRGKPVGIFCTEPLIRLTDHEAARAADRDIIEQLYRQRDDYAMHNMAVRQCIGIPASVGVNEPIEGFEERPQDLAPAVRDMALIIEADKARIAELEEFAREIIKQYPNPDITHEQFRVHACRHAEHALAAHQKREPGQP